MQNKLKAKNQIAEFIEEEEELDVEFEELMDYKYGASKWKDFHFEQDSRKPEHVFCPFCDSIHTSTAHAHESQCQYAQLSKSPLYYFESIGRIKDSLGRMNSREALDLRMIASKIEKGQPVDRDINELSAYVREDPVLSKIVFKLKEVI